MDIWIGTSGYSYPDWVGTFYADGTRPERMLEQYSQAFPLVELNFTFYRPPTPEMLHRLAEKTGKAGATGFQFLVKLPQTISHEESPRDLPGFRKAVEALEDRHQLAGLLCQLPQATHNTPQARAWIETVARELADLRLAVEFRHRSWATREVPRWLGKLGVDLVAVDAPKLPGLYPSGWAQSTPRVYVRLHSRSGGNWYKSDKERYDYDYGDAEMGEWVEATQEHAVLGETERALFLFNNCHRGHAAHNARRMRTLFERQAPDLHVVAPFVVPTPVQGTLFG
jgi:uncharacterized protein YecE (DUF72 family)